MQKKNTFPEAFCKRRIDQEGLTRVTSQKQRKNLA